MILTCPSCHAAPRGEHGYCDACWEVMQVEWERAHAPKEKAPISRSRREGVEEAMQRAAPKALKECRKAIIRELDRVVRDRGGDREIVALLQGEARAIKQKQKRRTRKVA